MTADDPTTAGEGALIDLNRIEQKARRHHEEEKFNDSVTFESCPEYPCRDVRALLAAARARTVSARPSGEPPDPLREAFLDRMRAPTRGDRGDRLSYYGLSDEAALDIFDQALAAADSLPRIEGGGEDNAKTILRPGQAVGWAGPVAGVAHTGRSDGLLDVERLAKALGKAHPGYLSWRWWPNESISTEEFARRIAEHYAALAAASATPEGERDE